MRSAEIEAMARSERESETNVCHLSREGNKRKRVAARPKMVHYDFGYLGGNLRGIQMQAG